MENKPLKLATEAEALAIVPSRNKRRCNVCSGLPQPRLFI